MYSFLHILLLLVCAVPAQMSICVYGYGTHTNCDGFSSSNRYGTHANCDGFSTSNRYGTHANWPWTTFHLSESIAPPTLAFVDGNSCCGAACRAVLPASIW